MIYIYLENNSDLLSIDKKAALPALESQAIEIFSKLNSAENIILGLMKDDAFEFKILSFNKFIWRIEIINIKNKEKREAYYSTQKVIQIIHCIFMMPDPFTEN